MTLNELQIIKDNRLDGENLNVTRDRLIAEGKLPNGLDLPAEMDAGAQLPVPANGQFTDSFGPYDGEDDFMEEDLTIPRWKILQPTTRVEGGSAGMFYNVVTHEEAEKLEDIVFLSRTTGRVLFPGNDFSGNRVCWSHSGKAPAAEEIITLTGEDPKSELCVTKSGGQKVYHCPFSMWRDANGEPDTNGSMPPQCKETITFLGLDSELMPFRIIFHGMGIPPVKNFMKSIFIRRQQALLSRKKLGLRDFRFTIALELKMNDKGKFYSPKFENVKEISDAGERQMLRSCFIG